MIHKIPARKLEFEERLLGLLRAYASIVLIKIDYIRGNQIHELRQKLRNQAELLMGKNTLIRKIIKNQVKNDPSLVSLLDSINGNCGLLFTNSDVIEMRKEVISLSTRAAAKVGAISPCDYVIEPQLTGLDVGETAFFQSMGIPTRVARGQIEVTHAHTLLVKGAKVGASEAQLLSKLSVFPFSYNVGADHVFHQGKILEGEVLDMPVEEVHTKFKEISRNLAGLSFAANLPNRLSVVLMVASTFKKVAALAVAGDLELPGTEELKAILEDPEAAKSKIQQGKTTETGVAGKDENAAEESESEEEDVDMDDLFG